MSAELLEWSAAALSMLGVWLMTRRRMIGWPIGLVSVALYAFVFAEARLYSDTLLQIVFGGFLVYGWMSWRHSAQADGLVSIVPLPARRRFIDLGAGVAVGLALGAAMHTWTNAALPWLDAMLAAMSLVAQWWQARRHVAAWWMWIAVDVVYVGLYLFKSLNVTAALYAVFIGLAVLGLRRWSAAGNAPVVTAAGRQPARTGTPTP